MRHTRTTSVVVASATLLATAALTVASGTTADAATSANLVVNPTYASGKTGWAGDANTTFTTTTNGYNGSMGATLAPVAAGKVSLTDSPDSVAYTYAGATYTATVRVKNPTVGTTVNGSVGLTEVAPSSSSPLVASTPFSLSDTAWHTITVAGVAAGNVVGAPGGHGLSVAVTGSWLPVGRTLLVDDWTMVRDPNLPPVPSFTAASTYLTTKFDASASTDSDGTVVSYAWDFGDGTTGVYAKPSHTYATAGTRTVTLTATDDDGATATVSRTVTVVANVAPVAGFTATTSYLTAKLDASTSSDSDGTISTFAWSFGDGTTGTGRFPSHTYAAAGTYPVALSVTDNAGKTTTLTKQVTVVANVLPGASFTTSTTYLNASFDASASADTDGTIRTYAWNFGDGTTGTGRLTSHAYATAGTRTVTLTVTDDAGDSTTTTAQVTVVANVAPTAGFSTSTSYLTARFDASASTDSDGTIARWSWDYGDGTTGLGRVVSHTYDATGTYPVTLTVTDNAGKTGTQTWQVSVVDDVAPSASWTSTTSYLLARFDASGSTDTDGTIRSYSWDFGDGTTGTNRTASHTYAAAGTYPVTMTVTDDFGKTDTQTTSVTVVADIAPTAGIVPTTSYLTAKVNGTTSSDLDGTIVGYVWDFGDGTTATGKYATRTYDVAGTYTVTLTVTDDGGATDTKTVPVTVVANVLPTAAFSATTSYLTAQLDGSASTDTDGTIKSWDWTFGDGTTATGKVVSHTWLATGGKTVTLTVTDDYGSTSTKTLQVRVVANVLPTAAFTSAGSYRTARFDATPSADTDGSIVSYRWNFGDGTTGTGQFASRVYLTPGTRTVTLTVTDDYGSTATYSRTVTAVASPVVKLGVYNGQPNEKPDESTLSSFGRFPQVASTYYQPTGGINLAYETARINRGTSPNLTKTTTGTQTLAGIANGDPTALSWVASYVSQLKQLAAVNPNVPVYATIDHEFKSKVRNGLITGASADPLVYAKALSVFIAKVHAAGMPNLKSTYWMVGYDRAFEGQIGAALTQRPDVITFDPYANVAGDTIASVAGPDVEWLRAQAWYDDQPIAMSEFGMPVFNGDAALAAYYTDVRSQIDSLGISWAVLFDRARDANNEIATPTNDYPNAVRAFSQSLAY